MATVSYIVPMHQRRKDGTFNVKLRITHGRQSRYVRTSIYVNDRQVTASGKIRDYQVLDAVEKLVSEIRAEITGLAWKMDKLSVDELIVEIRRQRAANNQVHFPLFKFAEERLSRMNKESAISDRTAFRSFEEYLGHDPDITEIKARTLNGYIEWLMTDRADRKGMRAKSASTVNRYLSSIRWAYNEAKRVYNDYDDDIVRISGEPFKHIVVPAAKPARHRALSVQEIQSIIDCRPRGQMAQMARELFIISLGLQGMNLRDIVDIKNENGYCKYSRHKVRGTSGAEMVCRIEPEIAPYLDKWTDKNGAFVHKYSSYHMLQVSVSLGMKSISNFLGIDAIFYSARHSWASLARNECGADKWTVHEALLHSSRDTAIDDIYIKPDWSRIWELNKKVLELFDFGKLSIPLPMKNY